VEAVRSTIETCARRGVEYLTLLAFSSENWRRPADEVSLLMRLFVSSLQREVGRLVENGVRMRVVGQVDSLEPELRRLIRDAEDRTAGNERLNLTVCRQLWRPLGHRAGAGARAGEAGRSRRQPERHRRAALAAELAPAFAPDRTY